MGKGKYTIDTIRNRYMSIMIDFGYASKYKRMLLGAQTEDEMSEIMSKARKDLESRGV